MADQGLVIRRTVIGVGLLLLFVGGVADAAGTDLQRLAERIERDDLSDEETDRLVDLAGQAKQRAKSRMPLAQRVERALIRPWVIFGFLAQFAFMMRFVVQLIASERRKRSYVPVAFWYLSLGGGTMLFVYALRLRDPVFVFGQGLGCLIYIRNLVLIYQRKNAHRNLLEERRERAVRGGLENGSPPEEGAAS